MLHRSRIERGGTAQSSGCRTARCEDDSEWHTSCYFDWQTHSCFDCSNVTSGDDFGSGGAAHSAFVRPSGAIKTCRLSPRSNALPCQQHWSRFYAAADAFKSTAPRSSARLVLAQAGDEPTYPCLTPWEEPSSCPLDEFDKHRVCLRTTSEIVSAASESGHLNSVKI